MTPSPDLPTVRVLADADAVAEAAAVGIARSLQAAITARGRADWATTGGSGAPPIYRRLAASPLRDEVDWSRVHVWWGDDRYVPYDHPLSNVLPFEQILLAAGAGTDAGAAGAADTGIGAPRLDAGPDHPRGAPIRPDHIHRFATAVAIAEQRGADWAASVYGDELRTFGPERDGAGVPVLDLVVLGVGPDGHVLSVFPGSTVWDERELAASVPAPTHIEPHVARVTLHPSLVTAAREVMIVSTGASKAGALGRAWAGGDPREIPARLARRAGAIWLLDAAAAADLPTD